MNFEHCIKSSENILMEGALGERLKREYHLSFDEEVVMAGLVYSQEGRHALNELWSSYAQIAFRYHLPYLTTTPTRRVNKERIDRSQYDSTIIKANVDFLRKVQEQQNAEMYVGGLVGCRGDAYHRRSNGDGNGN